MRAWSVQADNMETMKSTVIFFIVLMLNAVQGLSLLTGNISAETSQALSEASTVQVRNALREIVNQESLVRFSMVQKIQELMLTVVENKKENEFLKKSIAGLRNDVTDLKKINQELQAKNEGLQLKFEEVLEIKNNSNRFQRVEREMTSLSQSVNDIREVQTDTAEDLRNISSSLSAVEKEVHNVLRTTPASVQNSAIAFYAYMSKSTTNGQRILVFDVVKTNIGGGYAPSSGTFVVPMTGTYVFSWTFRVSSDSYHSTQLMVNGLEYGILHLDTNPNSDVQETGLVVASVAKGDVVLVRTHAIWNRGIIQSNTAGRTSFAGWKL